MFKGLQDGLDMIEVSTRAFFKYPIILLPLLVVWAVYAPTIIFFKWHFNWGIYNTPQIILIIFLISWGFSFLLIVSSSVLLELLQQNETGRPFNLFRSLRKTFTKNIFQILVLSYLWALIWTMLTVLEALFQKKADEEGTKDETAESVAKTLSGARDASLLFLSFQALNKGIRMVIFLIMPAFAWEDLKFGDAIDRGFSVLEQRVTEYIAGYTLSYLASALVFFLPSLMFFLDGKFDIHYPDWLWIICIVYTAFAWSYTIYLEQLFTAELYLCQLKWENECRKAETEGRTPPKFNEIKRPSILDNKPDLIF